jgi:hypothetical protein
MSHQERMLPRCSPAYHMNERIQNVYAALCWLAFAIACQAFTVDLFARALHFIRQSDHQPHALKLLALTAIVQLIVAPFLIAAVINFCIALFKRPAAPAASPPRVRGKHTLRLLILTFVCSRNDFVSPFVTAAFRIAVVVTVPLVIYVMLAVTRAFLRTQKQNADQMNV